MARDIDKLLSYSLDQLNDRDTDQLENDRKSDPELNQAIQETQTILETIALAEDPIAPSKKLKQSLIASLNANTPFHGYIDRFMKLFDLERSTVESLFDKIVSVPETLFDTCAIPHTSLYYFDGGPKVAHTTCGLVKIKAGSIFPAHKHRGKEWVLVLQGTAIDHSGRVYLPGDTIFSDETISHALKVNDEEDLIFAVVLEKPNRWLIGQIILDYIFPKRRFNKQTGRGK